MSAPIIKIEPGQWVLGLRTPYGPYVRTMREILEGLAVKHWYDTVSRKEMFFVAEVEKVMPKTFTTVEPQEFEGSRISRSQIIASVKTKEAGLKLRDELHSIGIEAGEILEKEMYRRIEKYAARLQAKNERKIRRLVPHHFQGGAE